MRFAAWPAVYLLALVPALLALYAYAFRRQRRALAAFVARDLWPRLLPPIAERRRWLRAGCLIGAVACLVIALMQPEWGRGATELPLRGRDVIVLLDVSHSMLAEDVRPSRLAQAKAAARSLALAVQQGGGHRLGLLTFAGRADVQCPLTRDYRLFLKRLEDATTDGVARRGTSIGEAVRQAVRAFGELEPGYTDLVLITDGEDHASLPLEAAQMLGALQLSLATVGIGDPNRSAPIPLAAEGGVSHLIHDGQEVRSRMRRGLLVGMAARAGHERGAGAPSSGFHRARDRPTVDRADHVQRGGSRREARNGRANAAPAPRRVRRTAADPRRRSGGNRGSRGQHALRCGPVRGCASPVRGGGRAAPRLGGGRVQSRQRAVQEPRPGAGARSLHGRAQYRGRRAGEPGEVQHRRDQIPPSARRRAALRGRARLDPGGDRILPRQPEAECPPRRCPLQPGARLSVPPSARAGAAARPAQCRDAGGEDLAPARPGILRQDS